MNFIEKSIMHKKTPEKAPKLPAVTGPIIASIGPRESHADSDVENLERINLEEVDYYDDPRRIARKNQKNAGRNSYVISDLNPKNKSSYGYKNCTGVFVVGVDKKTGKNISLLTHQDPWSFLVGTKTQFEKDLSSSLQKFMRRVDEKTVDSVLFGGNYFIDERRTSTGGTYADDYKTSIKTLRNIIRDNVHVEPHVVIGPQTQGGGVEATLDTERRRLYISRREQEKGWHTDISFPASRLARHDKEWKKHYGSLQ